MFCRNLEAEALQDTIDAWEDKCNTLKSMLKWTSQDEPDGSWECPWCQGDERTGHAPGCKLKELIDS